MASTVDTRDDVPVDGFASPDQHGDTPTANAADLADDGAEDDEYAGLGHIPAQVMQSTESDTVRFRVNPDETGAYSPEHGRGELLSPTFHGGEVAYSKSSPPVPAALLRSLANGATVTPPAATGANGDGGMADLIG
uniref:Uncharacterized protein n=1 Tax=Neobodo designis TaxID=312471 RepID=A0A7S1M5K8_NEODS|mmetsp:Transcript_34684/g.107133  ORF Transcript_34684/g.107133 Transcript_34684/m.107133 type:complete len:136 (+) Transcript_34684:97-504(+)|eukprot:CAMPEP_0174855878 /NCGR_PEP_ID=MMETSP1114-20130205/34479_1 /TAXON_ID=312471 /ORGANISM="Neobodo designis, Strain CCAP 1951/1" /LENGTH=135 /DNA_ID=CAMNT_0016090651 /DNA_START=100 /DNA_END=507 /DNA_ORIENTATION=+